MRIFKIIAAALLVAAVVPGLSDAREHVLGAGSTVEREHIL